MGGGGLRLTRSSWYRCGRVVVFVVAVGSTRGGHGGGRYYRHAGARLHGGGWYGHTGIVIVVVVVFVAIIIAVVVLGYSQSCEHGEECGETHGGIRLFVKRKIRLATRYSDSLQWVQ